MRKLSTLLLFCVLSTILISCAADSEFATESEFALDTVVTVKVAWDGGHSDLSNVWTNIHSLEKTLSRTVEDGALYALNSHMNDAGKIPIELYSVIKKSVELSEKTGGAFDPTIALASDLWGITSDSPRVPSDDEIAKALSHCGADKLHFYDGSRRIEIDDPELPIDLGGAG